MKIVDITTAERARLLAIEEDHFNDLKGKDIKPGKLTDTVSAFANASGGEIYLGIEEVDRPKKLRSWNGFDKVEDANAHIQTIEQLAPFANHYSVEFLRCDKSKGLIAHFTIYKSREVLAATSGKIYIRKGAQKIPVDSAKALERLRIAKGVSSFEDHSTGLLVRELAKSPALKKFLKTVVPMGKPIAWITKQQLRNDDRATVAGVLLFSEEPQVTLPKRSAIKIYRYKTKNEEGARDTLAFDPLTIEGSLYELIYAAVAKTKELVEDIKKLGPKGLEPVVYPDETLHEIVTNAVLHRDYGIPADVHIRIFDNRIEVESPGLLPGHVTVGNILSEQFARNPKLVRLINKFPNPPNKDVGEGLNTAFAAMKKLRLKAPEIVEKENAVQVNIKHDSLASPETIVIAYLDQNPRIVNRVARELTGITSENSMKDVFIKLAKSGLIEQVPGLKGSAAAWRKKTQ